MPHFFSVSGLCALIALCGTTVTAQTQSGNYARGTLDMPATASADRPQNYLIKKGDTLWDLAFKFLGNPFNWPSIWKINPYVADPHWIYPGNALVIANGALTFDHQSGSSQAGRLKGLSFDQLTSGFLDATTIAAAQDILPPVQTDTALTRIGAILTDRVLTSEFRARLPFLCRTKDARGLLYPGTGRIDPQAQRDLYHQYDDIPVRTFGTKALNLGDTIEIYSSGTMLTLDSRKANLSVRTGLAVVTGIDGSRGTARLFEVWDAIKAGDRIGPKTYLASVPVSGFASPESALKATVIHRVGSAQFSYLYDTFIIDKGTSHGVRPGDLFAAFSSVDPTLQHTAALVACAALVEDTYSTMVIVKLVDKGFSQGFRAELVMSAVSPVK